MTHQRDMTILARDMAIGPVPVRRYRDEANPTTCLTVFAHGGGFTWGKLEDCDRLCRNILSATGGTSSRSNTGSPPPIPFRQASTTWSRSRAGRQPIEATLRVRAPRSSSPATAQVAASQPPSRGRPEVENGMQPDGRSR